MKVRLSSFRFLNFGELTSNFPRAFSAIFPSPVRIVVSPSKLFCSSFAFSILLASDLYPETFIALPLS